jgi:hypothetical protein
VNKLASFLGGKEYVVWLVGLIAALFKQLPMDAFQQLTMFVMIGTGVIGGITKTAKEGIESSPGPWQLLGGRKFVAWAAITILMFIHGFTTKGWMEVSGVYIGSSALEYGVFTTTNGLQKLVAAKTATAKAATSDAVSAGITADAAQTTAEG